MSEKKKIEDKPEVSPEVEEVIEEEAQELKERQDVPKEEKVEAPKAEEKPKEAPKKEEKAEISAPEKKEAPKAPEAQKKEAPKEEKKSTKSTVNVSDATPAQVVKVFKKVGLYGECYQVLARVLEGRDRGNLLRRNVRGPIKENDLLMLKETERDVRAV